MSKKAKSKKNRRGLRPPLTFLDKSIYALFLALSLGISFLFIVGHTLLKDQIAFSTPNTVAYSSDASVLFFLPFEFYFCITFLVIFAIGFESKKPIFGSKKYNYGEYPFREDCYPLFSKKTYYKFKRPSHKKLVMIGVIFWCIILILLASLIPLSLFGRNTMYQDNSIEKINIVNVPTDTYTPEDFSSLTISTYFHGRGRYGVTGDWSFKITIEMNDGKSFAFSRDAFNHRIPNAKNVCLNKMIEIKNLFESDKITIKGKDKLDNVVEDLSLNEEEEQKLRELFS